MYFLKDKKECCGCSACINICPKKCIKMKEDNEGFLYPCVFDSNKCINCKLCEKVCPIKNYDTKSIIPSTYAVKNKDEVKRKKSSSGGVFTAIAESILSDNGIIVGAMLPLDSMQ